MRLATATVILGAGFSFVAGLPLTKDLLQWDVLVTSRGASERFAAVREAWAEWHGRHADQGPEQFLEHVFNTDFGPSVPWAWIVELLAATLASPRPVDIGAHNLRYTGRLTRPVHCAAHDAFWSLVTGEFDLKSVATTNYDLLIERGLRHRTMRRSGRPGVHYGGLPAPQLLQGLALPFSVRNPERVVELSGAVPLYKLHGSLNWSLEHGHLHMYQDMRPAFRHGGDAAVVPPLPEKAIPAWLAPVWAEAQAALSRSEVWVICGYSLPAYDHTMKEMLRRAAADGQVSRLALLDPCAAHLRDRWASIAPRATCECLPGLPEGLDGLSEVARKQAAPTSACAGPGHCRRRL